MSKGRSSQCFGGTLPDVASSPAATKFSRGPRSLRFPATTRKKAHIYSFSPDGPRGHDGIDAQEINGAENLILVCHECHQEIDRHRDGGRYTPARLKEMKSCHERRVELVTGIDPGRRSHVLIYGANVGEHNTPSVFCGAEGAMFPDRYPAEPNPIPLGILDSTSEDKTPDYWMKESSELVRHFERRVRDRTSRREVEHLSVFAIAPQPLLVVLGTLLGDIVPADVYQRHREPQTWSWPASSAPLAFEVQELGVVTGPPALVLSLNATVTRDRIEAVLGPDVSIWNVSVARPNNDLVKSREHASQFRTLLRELFDRIKAVYGQTTQLHVFPAAPVSLAVEFGRARMPKSDMPWCIYDQNNKRGGFVKALNIPLGE